MGFRFRSKRPASGGVGTSSSSRSERVFFSLSPSSSHPPLFTLLAPSFLINLPFYPNLRCFGTGTPSPISSGDHGQLLRPRKPGGRGGRGAPSVLNKSLQHPTFSTLFVQHRKREPRERLHPPTERERERDRERRAHKRERKERERSIKKNLSGAFAAKRAVAKTPAARARSPTPPPPCALFPFSPNRRKLERERGISLFYGLKTTIFSFI